MPEQSRIIGIDLGTTNTLVASVTNRVARVVPTDRGSLIIPSVVGLSERGEIVVGRAAKEQMVTHPTTTIWGAKRLIGRKYDSKVVQKLKGYYPYEIVEGPTGDAAVRMGEKIYALPELISLLLKEVKVMSEQFLGGPVNEAVVSVPAYYNDNQRTAVKDAGRMAGFDVKRIVNEPTAAAMAYGFNKGLDQRVLVYDLGGGTFDVSVMHLTQNVFEVLASGGDTFLGGVDFDHRVVEFAKQTFLKDTKIDLAENPIALQRLTSAAEAAKIDLTITPHVVIDLRFVTEKKGRPLDLRVPLSREQLNALTSDLVERTFTICDAVLKDRGIPKESIDEILLVGGQSRMPLVQQRIAEHFGKSPRKGVHPDECVAVGAALLADSLGRFDAATLIDALSMPIGYAVGSRVKKVIEKNTPIPALKSFRLPAPAPGAQTIDVDVYQGDSDLLIDNEYLGTVRLPAAAQGKRIDFKIDEECILQVLVEQNGKLEKVTLATRDTPPELKRALLAELEKDLEAQQQQQAPKQGGGMLQALRRMIRS
jgi:molecular chaperone DnaK